MNQFDEWLGFGTALVADSADRFGVMRAAIRRLAGEPIAGPAFTAQVIAGENGTIHRAMNAAPPGSVLVIDAAGYEDRAVWGELITVAAIARGLRGVVIDGAVRDIAAIRRSGFAVFALTTTPAGPHRGWRGKVGGIVSCGGVVVSPGDVVVGDEDGVVVVAQAMAGATLDRSRALLESEGHLMRRAAEGVPTTELLKIE